MEPRSIADDTSIGERVHESLAPRVVCECRRRQHSARRQHIGSQVIARGRRRIPYRGIPQTMNVENISVAQLGCDNAGK